jgi:hypothetical protein
MPQACDHLQKTIPDCSLAMDPKIIARYFLYHHIFDTDIESSATRAIEQTLPTLERRFGLQNMLLALDEVLSSDIPLNSILPMRHTQAELLAFLKLVRSKIQLRMEQDKATADMTSIHAAGKSSTP